MDLATLVFWRNMAAVLLVLEAFLFSVPMLILLYFAVRGLRVTRAKLLEYFPIARSYVTRAESVTHTVSSALVTPPMRVSGVAHGVRAGLRAAVRPRRYQA